MMVLDIEHLKDARITITLILINVLTFFIFNLAAPVDFFLFFVQINRRVIENYEIWRLVTSIFFHADPIHLLSNMIGLLFFGATVENNTIIKKYHYLIIYFTSGIVGSIFTLILLPLNVISLGASGAIFGLLGVAFVMIATDYRPLLLFTLLYLMFFVIYSFSGGINFWAHIFGLIVGVIFGYFLYYRKRKIHLVY
jgi:rhomboid protease GluP